MSHNIISTTLFFTLVFTNMTISQSRLGKLGNVMYQIQRKFAMLEDKVDNDEIKFRDELKETLKEFKAHLFECGTWNRFGLSCYKFFVEEVKWGEAVAKCKLEDAYLTEIDSSAENAFIINVTLTNHSALEDHYDVISGYNNYDVPYQQIGPWLGASDKLTEGTWMWEYSGRNLNKSFQSWGDGEPNGIRRENCLHLYERFDYIWNDVSCDWNKPFICEKPVTFT